MSDHEKTRTPRIKRESVQSLARSRGVFANLLTLHRGRWPVPISHYSLGKEELDGRKTS